MNIQKSHNTSPVDAVVTWVDGDDPVHRQKRLAYLENVSPGETLDKRAAVNTRFSATFELEFNLRLLRKNAPWLRTVFLITDDQKPAWLDDVTREALGVKLVDHREVFKGYESALPVFNSRSIETLLFNIDGLSENFIYLNDDFFVIRPSKPSDWFSEEKVVVRGRRIHLHKVGRLKRKWSDKLSKVLFGYQHSGGPIGFAKEKELLQGRSGTMVQLYHAPFTLKRSRMAQILSDSGVDRPNCFYRFRSSNQVKPIPYVLNRMILSDEAKLANTADWYYVNGEKHRGASLKRRLSFCLSNQNIRMLCVNSIDQMCQSDQQEVRDLLTRFLE